ncbi:hypothetical protein ILUMI_06828, partial [Ignelater luminosus]
LFATTSFTKENARSVFPSFDEPNKKAQFVIRLIYPEGYTAISNEKRVSIEDVGNGYFLDTFKKTRNMSTYLVAFTISQFMHTEKFGLHQIFARPQVINEGKADYALGRMSELLKSVEDYFDIKGTFSKITHVVVPDKYMQMEASENWGHITYNEKTLLFSNTTSSSLNVQTIVTSILHELIHQWFGNLVTPSTWEYLWLSEGFATYLQFRIGDLIEPSWQLLDQFQTTVMERAFEGETTFYGTALNDDYQQQWVPYLKGSSIVRMLEHSLTPDIFRKGIQNYLQKNQDGVVKPLDLYKALQTPIENNSYLLGGNTVADIMETWDSSLSYPYINVTRDYETGRVTFTQGTFTPHITFQPDKKHVWYIPINYVFNAATDTEFANTTADFWLIKETFLLNTSVTDGWLIVNKQFSGYYRVMYDLENWNRLITFLKSPKFQAMHVLNRAQLINDAFDFAKRGSLNYTIPLDLSTYLSRERHYVAFASFFNAIELLNRCLSTSKVYPTFKSYILNLLSNITSYLGYDENANDTHLDKLNRANVLNWLCKLGDVQCGETALEKLRSWMKNESKVIAPNLQEPLLCGAIRAGNEEEWNFLFEKLKVEDNSIMRSRMLNALSCSEKDHIINKFLDEIVNGTTMKNNERLSATISILESGNVGLRIGTDYVQEHFRTFWKMEKSETILNVIGNRITTAEEYNKFVAFKSKYVGVHMAFRPGMSFARININWLNNYLSEVEDWLDTNVK